MFPITKLFVVRTNIVRNGCYTSVEDKIFTWKMQMVAQISKVRSAEMIIQYNLARPFRAMTFENLGSVT